jgi:two-component system, chemotaxis family, sensor kinase Cph1
MPLNTVRTSSSATVDPSAGSECCARLSFDSLHDLSSPVNQISTLTEMVLKRYGGTLDADGEVLLKHLQSATSRLNNLLAGLKSYIKAIGTRETYHLSDANAILAAALESIRTSVEQQSAVVRHQPLPKLYCDARQIACVFVSLIENAIKFRSDQGVEVSIAVVREQNFWVFSIRDNGIGIDPRHQARIFSMFKRVHSGAYSGAGIGLAVTRQIVEEHGGRIWVESQLGSGATFYFTLPASETL